MNPMNPSNERWAEGPTVLVSVWRYRWIVLAGAVLMGLVGYVLSSLQDEVYEATAVMFLANPETSGVFGQAARTDLDRYLPQQAERAVSSPVLLSAAELLGEGTSPSGLDRRVEASADIELGTVEITASANTSVGAAETANAIVAAYEQVVQDAQLERTARATDELRRAGADIEAEITAAQTADGALGPDGELDPSVAAQIEVLAQRLSEIDALRQQLEVDARLFGSGVEFVEEAEAPAAPSAPRPTRTAAALAIVGALLASAAAYWLAGRSQKVLSRDDPGKVLGVPLLGVLPTYSPADRGSLYERTSLDPRTAEAYRFVHTSLHATLRELDATSVMITSASPSTGKTETALQLAVTAHRRGQDVLLVDADLRMRGLTSFLRAGPNLGLRDTAYRAKGTATALVMRYPLGAHGELAVLSAGQAAEDGNEQLNETWFGPAFAELRDGHDLTVVDSPPLLAVADTAMIAGYTDAIVLVVKEGSDIQELERVRQRLQFVGQRLVGYVYLSPSALDDTAFDYGLVRAKAWEEPKSQKASWPDEVGAPVPVRGGSSPAGHGGLAESDAAASGPDRSVELRKTETRPVRVEDPESGTRDRRD